ncbi:DHHA1 domain-containing protein, partial [Pantoea sp. GbtcB22]|uniref:DHHA1 domain-containing protein n=1 Tax=Pantoea sp. GbtcB22 TaxID=2824767 RepID=UPI001C2F70F2
TKQAGTARLVFARSESLSHNVGQLLSEACRELGGKGGGRADLAQGGGPEAGKLIQTIEASVNKIRPTRS